MRLESHSAFYERDSETRRDFVLPQDQTTFGLRTGVRWGGKEPVLLPDLAMELSGWYEAMLRTSPGLYGLNRDRRLEQISHLFWARGQNK